MRIGIRHGSPDDENARRAVLLRFSCEPCHAGMSAWLNKELDPSDYPQRVHCKRGTDSARIVLNTRALCQDLVARFKDDGLPYSVSSPFCIATSTMLVRQSRFQEWQDQLEVFAKPLKENFLEEDTEGTHVVPTIDFRAQSSQRV